MILNKSSIRDGIAWIALALFSLAAVALTYWAALRDGGARWSGGSGLGLAAGIVGTALIAFAMALLARRTWRALRFGGSRYAWLQGHVWLGLVSYVIIWFHAGWRWGGPLTTWLMICFTAVWATGVLGVLVQNILPRIMFDRLPRELIYDQIPSESQRQLEAADELIATTDAKSKAGQELEIFYNCAVVPFLAHGAQTMLTDRPTTSAAPSPAAFADLRTRHPALAEPLAALERFVRDHQQRLLQRRLHWLLHGWLLIHVPLSVIMIVWIPVHAVFALRY
jgi:hypothetical protein